MSSDATIRRAKDLAATVRQSMADVSEAAAVGSSRVDVIPADGGEGSALITGGHVQAGDKLVTLDVPQGRISLGKVPDGWHNVPAADLGANWTLSSGQPLRYRVNASGEVDITGRLISVGAASATMFTLPGRYRPSYDLTWACWITPGSIFYPITVSANGVVTFVGGASSGITVRLDPILFLGEA